MLGQLLGASLVFCLLPSCLPALQTLPPVGSIDVYGLRRVADSTVRRAVSIKPGDSPPSAVAETALVAHLRAIPGVRDAAVHAVCCDPRGRTMLFIGIAEPESPRPSFRPAPTGSVRLPPSILARDSVFSLRFFDALRAGRNAEADSGGHEFFADSAVNAIQHEYLAFASANLPLLRDVLAHSASVRHRVLAAELLDYVADVRSVIPDFLDGMHDPASDVRNASMRALWVIAAYGQKEPGLGIRVPAAPFVDLLGSLDWTDRNKSSIALSQLTTTRDSTLLSDLRVRALRPLLDIARWTDLSHAAPAVVILGRIEGRGDKEIFASLQRGDRTPILEQAEQMLAK